MSSTIESTVDFAQDADAERVTPATLSDRGNKTVVIPKPEFRVATIVEPKKLSVAERIEHARTQTGVRIVDLFHVSEITELTSLLSGEELKSSKWRIRTHDEATKRVLRSTLLSFENQNKTEYPVENRMPRARKGNLAELEDRVSRLGRTQTLRVHLPSPHSPNADWAAMTELRVQTGGRVTFLPHPKFASVDYAELPIQVEKTQNELNMEKTTEMPAVEPKRETMLGKAWSKLSGLWKRKPNTSFEQAA